MTMETLKKYKELDWVILPLYGKRVLRQNWATEPPTFEDALEEITTHQTNVGILTGQKSGIVALDVDDPVYAEYDPQPAIDYGAVAHSTNNGKRLVIKSSNPQILGYSKKIVKKSSEVDKNRLSEGNRRKAEEGKNVTIVEFLGDGRQFMAPPSKHPETGLRLQWVTELGEPVEVNNWNELKLLLGKCFSPEIVSELFPPQKKEDRKERRESEWQPVIEECKSIPLKDLIEDICDEAEDRGHYIKARCPIPGHKDEHPSFAHYYDTNTWVCYNCDEYGDQIELVIKSGLADNFVEAVKWLRDKYNLSFTLPSGAPKIKFDRFSVEPKVHGNGLYARFVNEDGDKTVPVYIGSANSSFSPKRVSTDVRSALQSVGVEPKKGEPNTIIMKVKNELQDEEFREKVTVKEREGEEEQEEQKFGEGEVEKGRELVRDPYWLRFVKKTLDKKVVGEDDTKMLLFLICCSKEVDPQASYLIAESATGKSYMVQALQTLFDEDFIWFTRITPAALDRINKDLTGKVFVIGEDAGMTEEGATMLRQWVSEGNLRLLTTEKDAQGNIQTTEVETQGKPVVISTTTRSNIDPEMATRIWVMNPDTSKEQTERVLFYEASEVDGTQSDPNGDLRIIKAGLDELKFQGISQVYIPFANEIAQKFPKESVRARRDFKKVLSLIKVSAWLHQINRPIITNEENQPTAVVATPADLEVVKSVVMKSIKPTLTGLTDVHEEILSSVEDMEGSFTARDVVNRLPHLPVRTARKKLNELVSLGYLDHAGGGKGTPKQYEVIIRNEGDLAAPGKTGLEVDFGHEEFMRWLQNNPATRQGGSGGEVCFEKYKYNPLDEVDPHDPHETEVSTLTHDRDVTPPTRTSLPAGRVQKSQAKPSVSSDTETETVRPGATGLEPVDYEPLTETLKCDVCGVEQGTVLKVTYNDGTITYEHPRCLEDRFPKEVRKITDNYINPVLNGVGGTRPEQSTDGLEGYELEELEDGEDEDWKSFW